MPAALQSYINTLNTQMTVMGDNMWDAIYDQLVTLHDQLTSEGCPNSGDVVMNIRTYVGQLRNCYTTAIGSFRVKLKNPLQWINDNWPDGGAVDMDAIINAMFTATFNELEKFIGLVDAYRLALWNAPFNAEWYASIARGFQKWP